MNANTDRYDGIFKDWIARRMPQKAVPFIRLFRLDRPIGIWLLAWPALWGLSFASHSKNLMHVDPKLLAIFLPGVFLTRSAGCIINDIADREIDRKVARTKSRPIASGAISVQTALIILCILLLAAFGLLVMLNSLTVGLGVLVLVPILLYPFMKRITFWPQAMLGLCFSAAALMGWTAVAENLNLPAILLTIAVACWTIGYDTIYAHMDREDDEMIGIKSTARKFGNATQKWLTVFYSITILLLFIIGWLIGTSVIYQTAVAMATLHAGWQISTLDINNPDNCLTRFRSNNIFGIIIFVGITLDMLMQYLASGVI